MATSDKQPTCLNRPVFQFQKETSKKILPVISRRLYLASLLLSIRYSLNMGWTVHVRIKATLLFSLPNLQSCPIFWIIVKSYAVWWIDCYNQVENALHVSIGKRNPGNLLETRWYFCCGSLVLFVLAVHIYTLVHLLCEWHILVKFR